jgi:hypothetical protein
VLAETLKDEPKGLHALKTAKALILHAKASKRKISAADPPKAQAGGPYHWFGVSNLKDRDLVTPARQLSAERRQRMQVAGARKT